MGIDDMEIGIWLGDIIFYIKNFKENFWGGYESVMFIVIGVFEKKIYKE